MNNPRPPQGGRICCLCRLQGRPLCHNGCPLAPYFPPGTEANIAAIERFCGLQAFINILNLAQDDHKDAIARAFTEDAHHANRSGVGCPQSMIYLLNELTIAYNIINELFGYGWTTSTQAQPMTNPVNALRPVLTNNNTTAPRSPVQINPQSHHHRRPVHHVQQQQVHNTAQFGENLNIINYIQQQVRNLVQANAPQNVQEFQDNNLLDQQRQQNHQAQNDGGPVENDVPTAASSVSSSESQTGDPNKD